MFGYIKYYTYFCNIKGNKYEHPFKAVYCG